MFFHFQMLVVFLILVIFHVDVSGFAPLSTTTNQYQTLHQQAGIGSHLIRNLAHESSDTNHYRNATTGAHQTSKLASKVRSVNYHICRKCNYACKFCFHSQKNTFLLPLDEAKKGLKLLKHAGMEKINFAGGEPFIHDIYLGELCRYSKEELDLAVSIISNGSLVRPYWMKLFGEYVDILGISIDSFHSETNTAIGRGSNIKNNHIDQTFRVRDLCSQYNIAFKMNTVVCSLNWEEDMTEFVKKIDPYRWKVFQVLLLEMENTGLKGELKDATNLVVTNEQFWSFIARHEDCDCIIPEPNNLMQNSYLLLDEKMCFMNSSNGSKVAGDSILHVGVENALKGVDFDENAFIARGGVYKWTRLNN